MASKANAAHILVGSEKDANGIMTRIGKGEEFAALAKRFSKCPSKNKGGDLGWFGRGDMVPEFDEAVFSAKKGDLLGPIRTQFGWHVILVKDLK
ncbi:MAG: peptidylprolyl isomerase [Thermoplasmatales archaeon]|nr:peptidylprolyl isomerase [Thermoplasmatales archaeon]